MTTANAHPVKAVFEALVDTLRSSPVLSDNLTDVLDRFAPFEATVSVGKITIYCTVEDSESEEPSHSNAGESITSFLPTRFVLICDTQLESDADAFITKSNSPSLLDHEASVIYALQNSTLWGVPQLLCGWTIDGIQRDVAVITSGGEIDPQVRRFEIAIRAEVITERTDQAI